MEAVVFAHGTEDSAPRTAAALDGRLRLRAQHGALIWISVDAASLATRILLPDTVERMVAELAAVLKSVLPPDSLIERCGYNEFAAHLTDLRKI
jgi:hypothetical protein